MTPSSCLKAASCSSSTTMRPSSGKGRNSAERAPTTTRASPLRHGAPGDAPLGRGRDRNATAPARAPKRALEALEPLRAERDLRQQHQHLAAAAQRRGDRLEIDLGLARAGDAVEHGDARSRRRRPCSTSAPAAAACACDQRRTGVVRDRVPRRPAAAAARPPRARRPIASALTTPAPTPASRASSAVGRGGPSASRSSTRRRAAVSAQAGQQRRVVAAPPGRRSRAAARARPGRAWPCAAPRPAATSCSARPSRRSGEHLGQAAARRAWRRRRAASRLADFAAALAPDHADDLAAAERHDDEIAAVRGRGPASAR